MLIIKIALYLLAIISIAHFFKYVFHTCRPRTVHSGGTYLFSTCRVCSKLMPKEELIAAGKKLDEDKTSEIYKELILSWNGLRWRFYRCKNN